MLPTAADIASRLHLKRSGTSWRGPCPACGYPDSFSVCQGCNGRTLFYCASCQDRNAIADAVARHTGRELPRELRPDATHDATRERKQQRALALWHGSEAAVDTLADCYLTARGLPSLAASSAIRFRCDTPHLEGGRLPAMIALVTDVNGTPVAVHRTYLNRDGGKANVKPAKASLGPVWGGSIRLYPVVGEYPLVIGEGIETAASAGRRMGCPAWAAISAGNMRKGLVLPPEARHIIIAADPDDSGRNAANDAGRRWTDEGRKVQIATPKGSGDFNDILQARGMADA